MLTTRLNLHRPARIISRGGFTLVELLVVIGIIAILAGVALGPITNGIKKAKQSSGLQSAHAIGLALYSAANDNSQIYPDLSGGGADAGTVASALLAGGYITDAGIFSLSGDSNPTYVKVSSTSNTATTIKAVNVSWDFGCTTDGSGLSTTVNTYMPILWSTVAGGTPPTTGAATNPIYAKPESTNKQNPFGTDGVAVFYINNSSAFVTSIVTASALQCPVVSGTNNLNGVTAKWAVASGN